MSRSALALAALALAALALAGCGDDGAGWVWELPPDFPEPRVPADNPMTREKVELGRFLFYDVRLSGNQTQACGSCHQQSLAFTDGMPVGIGSTGDHTPRGSMGLTNIAYAATLTWANPVLRTLEDQALGPMFGEDPVELGLAGREAEMLARLREDERYQRLFPLAFPEEADPFTVGNVTKAIAAFERTLLSYDAPYDRYQRGDASAMSESAVRGMEMFFSEGFECFHCHGGFNFTDSFDTAHNPFDMAAFHNTGLYDVDGRGAYPAPNTGLFAFTEDRRHMGAFKAPTLRNVAVTAPYMHDGSIATLDEVLDHYAAGGRNVTEGDFVGDGRANPNKSIFVDGFELSPDQREDLLAFLHALTDEGFLADPALSDPFP